MRRYFFSFLAMPALITIMLAHSGRIKTFEKQADWAEKDSLYAGYKYARQMLIDDGQKIFASETNGYSLDKAEPLKFKIGYIYTLIYITAPIPISTAAHQGAYDIRVYDQDHTVKDATKLASSRLNEKGCQMYAVKVQGHDKDMNFRFDGRYKSMYVVGEKKE
jgi:hypothetical protein